MFTFDREPRRVWAQTEADFFDLENHGRWQGKDVRLWLENARPSGPDAGPELKISVSAEKSALCRVYIAWDAELPADVMVLGDHWERGYGDLEFRGLAPERVLPWYFVAKTGDAAFAAGVKTGPGAFCHWKLSRDTLTLCVDVRNGGGGTLLNGRVLDAAAAIWRESGADGSKGENNPRGETPGRVSGAGEPVFAFVRRFLRELCPAPRMPREPLYGGNNWYYAYGESSAGEIMEDSALISSLAPDSANRPFMFIDDGWQVCRNEDFCGGPWHEGNRKFPDMPGLCGKMKREGVRPGLWIRPLLNCRNFPVSWRLPQTRFLARELGGEYGCFLDPSVPEALETIKEDVARIAGWGFEAVKHDYTTYDLLGRWGFDMGGKMTNDGWSLADRSVTTMEIILSLYKTIKEAAGDALVLGCNTVSHASAGLFEAQRTGDDTSGRDWERTRKMGVNTMAFRCAQHGAFYAADADCVGITPLIPWRLNRQWLELVAGSGTPLLVSADPKTVTAEQKRDLAAAFRKAAAEQPVAQPLDWLRASCPSEFLLGGEIVRFRWDE